MKLSIPRGIIYHKLFDDSQALVSVFFKKLDRDTIVEQWEKVFAQYINQNYSVAFPYARTAIYYALKSQKLPAGSEIIMPPISIKGILDVVLALNLQPVFVDIDLNTLCFDMKEIDAAITPKTKAILITYLFGIVPNMEDMIEICKKNNLFTIEDFSQCLNGKYKNKKVGSFGNVGVYSASSIKTLDTYGGGLLVCNDSKLHELLKSMQSSLSIPSRMHLINKIIVDLIRNLATSRLIFHFIVFPLLKVFSILNPDGVMKITGKRAQNMIKVLPERWFEKYTSFQAELGLKTLSIVQSEDAMRIKNVEYLKSTLTSLSFPKNGPDTQNVYWQFVAFFNNPKDSQKRMHKMGVDTSTTSLELISSLDAYPYKGDTPNANYLYIHGMFIPSFPGMSKKDLKRVSSSVNIITKQRS
ncbi:MAG: perosamine synthetase [Methylophilaceae bacterium]|jgi:perosamine synthetase